MSVVVYVMLWLMFCFFLCFFLGCKFCLIYLSVVKKIKNRNNKVIRVGFNLFVLFLIFCERDNSIDFCFF